MNVERLKINYEVVQKNLKKTEKRMQFLNLKKSDLETTKPTRKSKGWTVVKIHTRICDLFCIYTQNQLQVITWLKTAHSLFNKDGWTINIPLFIPNQQWYKYSVQLYQWLHDIIQKQYWKNQEERSLLRSGCTNHIRLKWNLKN